MRLLLGSGCLLLGAFLIAAAYQHEDVRYVLPAIIVLGCGVSRLFR